jgi:hypothetical protein
MTWRTYSRWSRPWYRWFAWHPVVVDVAGDPHGKTRTWVWLVYVERQWEMANGGDTCFRINTYRKAGPR